MSGTQVAGKQYRVASISMPHLSSIRETDRFATKPSVGNDIMVAYFNQMVAMQQSRSEFSIIDRTLENKFNMDSRWIILGDRLNPKAQCWNCCWCLLLNWGSGMQAFRLFSNRKNAHLSETIAERWALEP